MQFVRSGMKSKDEGRATFPEPSEAFLKVKVNHVWVELVQQDICFEKTDAIVNAANEHLQHAGGLAGAIIRSGGREI